MGTIQADRAILRLPWGKLAGMTPGWQAKKIFYKKCHDLFCDKRSYYLHFLLLYV
jgi:hypothetical protein